MEGFLSIRLPLWQRRLLTRFVTLIPILIIGFLVNFNEQDFENLIVYAQIALSIALPFTLFPMILLTSNSKLMKEHTNSKLTTIVGLILAGIITILNLRLIFSII